MKIEVIGKMSKATSASAGYDLFAVEDFEIYPGEQKLIRLKLWTKFDEGFVGIVKEKSGNSLRKKLRVHAGVIDADYRGEWGVILSNGGSDLIEVKQGQAIAQVIFIALADVQMKVVNELSIDVKNERTGGYGSSGVGIT